MEQRKESSSDMELLFLPLQKGQRLCTLCREAASICNEKIFMTRIFMQHQNQPLRPHEWRADGQRLAALEKCLHHAARVSLRPTVVSDHPALFRSNTPFALSVFQSTSGRSENGTARKNTVAVPRRTSKRGSRLGNAPSRALYGAKSILKLRIVPSL
jgi:hypothetical protein